MDNSLPSGRVQHPPTTRNYNDCYTNNNYIFGSSWPAELPPERGIECEIETDDAALVNSGTDKALIDERSALSHFNQGHLQCGTLEIVYIPLKSLSSGKAPPQLISRLMGL